MAGIREIVLDTETTGLDPASGHRVVEIGCVELIDRLPTGNYYHTFINPMRDMPTEAYNVHGISEEFLKDKPTFRKIAQEFLDFISTSNLVIHNAAFDIKFLNHELALLGKKEIRMSRAIDTLLIARKKFPGRPANLDALCRRFKISLESRDKHGALIDSELLARVYLELMGGSQKKMSLEEDQGLIMQEIKNIALSKRSFEIPANDLEEHNDFIDKKIKNSLWKENK
jgi:DNA polymerase-3 subunit epsilon